MSEQEVTYSTLRFPQSPSESQNRLRPGSVQRSKKTDNKGFSLPWNLIVVSLGIICLLLLMTVAVLGLKVFQHLQEKRQLEDVLQRLRIKYDILTNDSYVKEQLLTNKALEYDILKNKSIQQPEKELDSGSYEHVYKENVCHRKALSNKDRLSSEWSCCGKKCYYFSNEAGKWSECKNICGRHNSSLLKIMNKEELTFIQTQVYRDQYWIGLSYDKKHDKWKWFDNTNFSGISSAVMTLPPKHECAFMASTRIDTIECSNKKKCLCMKIIASPLLC